MVRKLLRPTNPFDIQPDTLIVSDPHLHERKEFEHIDPETGLNTRLVEGLNIFKQIATILKEHPEITYLYFLGDLFELKDKVPNHILIEFQKVLSEIDTGGINISFLLGNHDFNLPEYPTAKLFDIHLITKPQCLIRPDGVKTAFLPYQRDFETFIKEWKELDKEKPDIFFFHQELPGVEYETGRKIGGIFPQSFFHSDTLYISGHIHKHQIVGKALYVGSPYQTKFSDEGQNRYIWVLNSKTKKYSPIKLNYPEFKSLDIQTYRGAILSETLLENISGTYIRVVGEIPASQWDVQTRREIKTKLEKAGAKGISFQVQVSKQRQVQIPADKVDDDESIIKLYVDQNDAEGAGLDKSELVRIGLGLFKPN